MSDYTPTTEEVRLTFARLAPPRTNPLAEFDRWKAQNDAEVRKQAAEEIAQAIDGECPHEPDLHAEGTCEICDFAFAMANKAREIGGAS